MKKDTTTFTFNTCVDEDYFQHTEATISFEINDEINDIEINFDVLNIIEKKSKMTNSKKIFIGPHVIYEKEYILKEINKPYDLLTESEQNELSDLIKKYKEFLATQTLKKKIRKVEHINVLKRIKEDKKAFNK
jgi:hypothetical protein